MKAAVAISALLALLGVAHFVVPAQVEARLNRVARPPPYRAPGWARSLARDSVDLHADPLLWGRDLLRRGTRGHIDVPRLQDVHAGLTPLGRSWLRKLEERRIVVDLAHASARTVDDVLAAATRPVVVSHTGVKGTCDNARNLSDAQLHALARNGALVGIGYWQKATCGTDAAAIARALRHAADLIGVRHLALGSDFDGAVAQPFDVTGVPLLAQALRAERFSDAEIRAIFSGNALRFLEQALP